MNARKAQKLRNTLLITGTMIALLGVWLEIFAVIGIVVMLSCMIPEILYNRCPHCRKNLGRNEGDYCQFCGKAIDK